MLELYFYTEHINYEYRWESNYIDQAKNTNCTVIGSNLSSDEGTSLKKTEQNSIKSSFFALKGVTCA